MLRGQQQLCLPSSRFGSNSYYLAADDAQFKMFWMHAIAKIIRKLLKDEPAQTREEAGAGGKIMR